MVTILLSDRALKDFCENPLAASKCITSLSQIPCANKHTQITKLKHFKPSIWRYKHFCDAISYRVVFTIAQDASLVIHRILPRSKIDYGKDISDYLYKELQGNEVPSTEIIDLDDEKYFDHGSTEDIEDCVYRDQTRHYRLPQTLLEQAGSLENLSQYILAGNYLYRPKLTAEQEGNLSHISNNQFSNHDSPHIIPIQGGAGTGKTILAFHLADAIIEQGFYPLVVVPNRDLQQFGQSLINGLDKNYRISQTPGTQTDSDLCIVTTVQLFQELSGHPILSVKEANQKLRKAFEKHGFSLPESLQYTNLYAIQQAIIESDNQYNLSGRRDTLIDNQEQVTELLHGLERKFKYRKIYKSFSDIYNNQDLASQARKIESSSVSLRSLICSDQPIALIVDEIQDYYWLQLKVMYSLLKRDNSANLFVLLGDENQRVTISGFTWAGLSNSFGSDCQIAQSQIENRLSLNRNFRNTKAIAKAANFFLSNDFLSRVIRDGRHPQPLLDPEACFEAGSPPRLIEFNDDWLLKFIAQLQRISAGSSNSRFVFLVHEKLKETFQVLEQAIVLNVQEAKGQEFDAVILVSPFLFQKEVFSLDDLFQWYTAITRARRYEAILVSREEMQWLQNNVSECGHFEECFEICSCSELNLEEFTREVQREGRSLVTVLDLQRRSLSQVAEAIINWGEDDDLLRLTAAYRNDNLNWWAICEGIETKDQKQDTRVPEQNCLKAIEATLQAKILLQEPPKLYQKFPILYQGLLILYFGTKNWLGATTVELIESRIIQQLERWFSENLEVAKQVLDQTESCESRELRFLLLRATGNSWRAVDWLKQSVGEDTYDWIEKIASDLERRGLPYEAARLKSQYLTQLCPSNYPLPEVLDQREPLSVVLCNHFTETMEKLL